MHAPARKIKDVAQRLARKAGVDIRRALSDAEIARSAEYIAVRKDHREIWVNASRAARVYLPAMANRFDMHHSSVVPENVAGRAVVDFSRPRIHRLTRSGGEVEIAFEDSYISVRKDAREIRINRGHDAYLWDMGNWFEYYASAVEAKHHNGKTLVDYSRPQLHRLTRSGVEFEFPSLPESDESTEVYLETLQIKPGDVVLDLGAYAGASAYFLAHAVGPNGLVVSLEPDETNFHYLEANIARHQLSNVKALKAGIWKERTTLPFQAEGNMGSAVASILGRDSNVQIVDVVTLDDAAALAGERRVNAIKMDVEGAELEVLRSSGDFLRRHRPHLIVEAHFIDGVRVVEPIREFLHANGYSTSLPLQGSGGEGLIAAHPNE